MAEKRFLRADAKLDSYIVSLVWANSKFDILLIPVVCWHCIHVPPTSEYVRIHVDRNLRLRT